MYDVLVPCMGLLYIIVLLGFVRQGKVLQGHERAMLASLT